MRNLLGIRRLLALALAGGALLLLAPGDAEAQRSPGISGAFGDVPAKALTSAQLRMMLTAAFDASGKELPRGALDRIMAVYDRQPDVEIVVYDPSSGRVYPGQLTGRAQFSVGGEVDAGRVCGAACSGFGRSQSLTLTGIQGQVMGGSALGQVDVTLPANSRATGVIDPQQGWAYVRWPVSVRGTDSQLFGSGYTTQAVFEGYGQVTQGGGFLVVDVAELVINGDRYTVTNKNCVNSGSGGDCNGAQPPERFLGDR